jgi:hypothetical protein
MQSNEKLESVVKWADDDKNANLHSDVEALLTILLSL